MKAYMSHFIKRKNAKIGIRTVTVKSIDGIYYHVECGEDIHIGEMEKPIEGSNEKVYIYSFSHDMAYKLADEYRKK